MYGEIITIGDELISGRTLDLNAKYAAGRLTASGLRVTRITSVGDDHMMVSKTLAKAMETSQLCPRFPAETPAIIAKLPSAVSLKPANNRLFWVPTKSKIRTRWLCRFPPVVPNSEVMYRKWIGHLL